MSFLSSLMKIGISALSLLILIGTVSSGNSFCEMMVFVSLTALCFVCSLMLLGSTCFAGFERLARGDNCSSGRFSPASFGMLLARSVVFCYVSFLFAVSFAIFSSA